MKLIDYICQASGWTPVTREDAVAAWNSSSLYC